MVYNLASGCRSWTSERERYTVLRLMGEGSNVEAGLEDIPACVQGIG